MSTSRKKSPSLRGNNLPIKNLFWSTMKNTTEYLLPHCGKDFHCPSFIFLRKMLLCALILATMDWSFSSNILSAGDKLTEWVDDSGKFRVTAEFLKYENGILHLKKEDGQEIKVSASRLSLESKNKAMDEQKYLDEVRDAPKSQMNKSDDQEKSSESLRSDAAQDKVGEKVGALDPSLTITEKRLTVSQRRFFFNGFQSMKKDCLRLGANPEVVKGYDLLSHSFGNLKKPVPTGIGFLTKVGDSSFLFDIRMTVIEQFEDDVCHVVIGFDHVLLELANVRAGCDYVIPLLCVELNRINVLQTVSGKPIHLLGIRSCLDIKDEYLSIAEDTRKNLRSLQLPPFVCMEIKKK